jgi:hypothetical protein
MIEIKAPWQRKKKIENFYQIMIIQEEKNPHD